MATKTLTDNVKIEVDDQLAVTRLVDQIGKDVETLKALEAKVTAAKKELGAIAYDFYAEYNLNSAFTPDEVVQTFDATGRRYVAQIDFMNKYRLDEEKMQELQEVLTGVELNKYFETKTVASVEVTKLSAAKQLEFYQSLQELCKRFKVDGIVDEKPVAKENFHKDRWIDLSSTINDELQDIIPVHTQVTV